MKVNTLLNLQRTHRVLGRVCFGIITLGQWFFGAYIVSFYYRSALAGDFLKWNEVLPHGYIRGDGFGNLLMGLHVLIALVLVWGGPLQFFPLIRSRFAGFHRSFGKVYLVSAVLVSIAGMIFTWARGAAGDTGMAITITLQGGYILLFSLVVIRLAIRRDIKKHEAWAFRLFLVTSGVWFFRVLLMAWLFINGKPAGFDPDTFSGPFLTFFIHCHLCVTAYVGCL
ncbi:MAG: DUF2306 domain-containing protein [Leadbetterella sp.]|nr:DUF2306 domain-containing protein [Leadbetterella sp.]